MPIIIIPKALRDKLGEDGAEALVSLINQSDEKTKEDVIALSAEKFEVMLSEEASKLDRRITEEVAKLDRRITEESAKLRVEIAGNRIEIQAAKADMIRWMFIFWVGQIGAIIGILFAFFKG